MLFRVMQPAKDRLPQVGPSSRKLGVRVPDDIEADSNGDVGPGTGGLSVTPSSMWDLPHHRRPRGMGQGASGPPNDCVYGIEEDELRPHPLVVRPDLHSHRPHAFIEPSWRMQLTVYEAALANTRNSWLQVWP